MENNKGKRVIDLDAGVSFATLVIAYAFIVNWDVSLPFLVLPMLKWSMIISAIVFFITIGVAIIFFSIGGLAGLVALFSKNTKMRCRFV